jgi:hypothetical protein
MRNVSLNTGIRHSYDYSRIPEFSFDDKVLATGLKKELPIAKKMKLDYD